jgi:adenosine deaminase
MMPVSRITTLFVALVITAFPSTFAEAASTESYFNKVKSQPLLLREFLYSFPKGGELHTHLDGAVYAESLIRWSAADGKCIDWASLTLTLPPCDAAAGRPSVSDVHLNEDKRNAMIDAFSVRNYERRPVSGHDQFFATFARFSAAGKGRQGSMLAEVTARAERQNTLYMEIMESYGMGRARKLAAVGGPLAEGTDAAEMVNSAEINTLVEDTIAFTNSAEAQWRSELSCDAHPDNAGCNIHTRYLAQVIRTFPPQQVLAQTVLAFKLIEADSRYVGLNFVAPEDAAIALRDYSTQMQIIAQVAALFPGLGRVITLHAGELALPLVSPDVMRDHIHQAVHVAGAARVGHGIDIAYEDGARALLKHMAEQGILVEINLTSNAVILEVEGDEHPFELYRSRGVPLALSTDDEGVARIDLTHEYVRATQTYDLSYAYLKELSRNALAYSFLPGGSLFSDIPRGRRVKACARDRVERALSDSCSEFLRTSEKARLQWELERRFSQFESNY